MEAPFLWRLERSRFPVSILNGPATCLRFKTAIRDNLLEKLANRDVLNQTHG